MDLSIFAPEHYQWQLSLIALVAVLLIPALAKYLIVLIPTFKQTSQLNAAAAAERVKRSYYPGVQKRSIFWGLLTQVGIFALILPFVMTAEPQPWWLMLAHIFVILIFYDFFYYLTHRFLFHDGGFGPGPLMWVHSVHHQQRNPCRKDSSYLHPIETCMGLALYGLSIGFLGWVMGDFHVLTIIITWIAFSEINLHNHDLMDEVDRAPFKYLKYMSFMHHVHHARFTAGNFATISLFYDWLFGTYDTGQGWGKKQKGNAANATPAAASKP